MVTPAPAPRTRLLLAVLAVIAGLMAACAPSDPPPTSPLGGDETGTSDPGDGPTQLPTFTPTPTPDGTATDTPTPTPVTNAAAEAERVTGEAISRLAEWIGAPETEFRLTKIEAVSWPDACLGIDNPLMTCAEVVTPGYRVSVHHVDAPDRTYFVHASRLDRYYWAPTHGPESRRIAEVHLAGSTITLEARDDGEDRMGTEHRVVAGSTLEVPLADLEPGQEVIVGTAGPLGAEPSADGLVVLLAPAPG